ncbi:putative 4-hydroxybenzoyl-CoA reductase molybdenum cofactor biosynthesis protein [Rhodospirillaceae bacterium LM-1]|nr:putative 4-hydroxybenzoyl-CoA reductase molybdenum cofactor biosynthesis protein [Rhodospirillaceae bacterium LM-1]
MISPRILVKGAGEMASAVAHRLFMANMKRICVIDLENPLAVRRTVSFCPALESGLAMVEGVTARPCANLAGLEAVWAQGHIGIVLADRWQQAPFFFPDVLIDAILAKRNLGTRMDQASQVIALGPGFSAGQDAHLVIETNRGHDLGRIIENGAAAPNTGIPGSIAGFAAERVLRASADGVFTAAKEIGDAVGKGEIVGWIGGVEVPAPLDGVVRGLIRTNTIVTAGLKIGDIDPRGDAAYCHTISDKARAIAGAVLEAVLRHANH